ncbi:PTS system, ascorbate-specific IIC component [[Mycoplasma] cavipharyngis]|uniref:PTS ascorbate transporter subunit IIC n=1 Tax=[Mycoplasma] cavipharyngis TaxID=92757 RepID=UPI003704A335
MNENDKTVNGFDHDNLNEAINKPKSRFGLFPKAEDKIKKLRNQFQESNFYKSYSGFMSKYDKYVALSFFIAFVLSWFIAFIVIGLTNSKGFGEAARLVFNNALIVNFLGIGPVLIAVLIALGYRLAKKSWSQVLLGFIKGFIGVLILGVGAGILIGTARPIFLALGALNTNSTANVVPLDPYFGQTTANNFFGNNGIGGSENITSIIYISLVFGFALNIILVALKRFTNLRAIFVTGHIMIQQSGMFSIVVYLLFLANGITGSGAFWGTAVLAGLAVGTYWAYGSSLSYYATNKVTDNAGFAVGHQQMIAIAIAYKIGKYFGRPEKDAENLRLPKFLRIFEDNIFTQALIIFSLFLIFVLVIQYSAPNEAQKFWIFKDGTYQTNTAANFTVNTQSGNLSQWSAGGGVFWFYGFLFGIFKIVGSILIIVYGVRMFVTELQESFLGISSRLIPDATVGVDIAATFGYSQTSVTIGFIAGTIGQFVAVAILYGISLAFPLSSRTNFPIVLPIFITLFFNSGAVGIYANKSGGLVAAIVVPIIFALLEILVITLGISSINSFFGAISNKPTTAPSPFQIGYNGMADPNFFFGGLFALVGLNGQFGFLLIVLWVIILLFLSQIIKYHDDTEQTYLYKKYQKLADTLSIKNWKQMKKLNPRQLN